MIAWLNIKDIAKLFLEIVIRDWLPAAQSRKEGNKACLQVIKIKFKVVNTNTTRTIIFTCKR